MGARPLAEGLEPSQKLSLLMELRPAIDGFAGIPQETRLLFALFRGLPQLETSGLILHGARQLPAGIPAAAIDADNPDRDLVTLSRAVVALAHRPRVPFIGRLKRTIRIYLSRKKLAFEARRDTPIELSHFLGEPFRDFVWEHFFARTLTSDLFDQVTGGHFALMRQSYRDLQQGRSGTQFPVIDTKDYDVFLAQTPWPSRVHPNTRLVVRYHDAIPLLLPHTIQSAPYHQNAHYTALLSNQRDGIFVCNSEHTRRGLLRFFPRLEDRSPVIPDVVSANYFPEEPTGPQVRGIIENRRLAPAPREGGGAETLPPIGETPLRYLIVVSTIEPRKNHARAIAAWAAARAKGAADLKLVVVGSVGWTADSAVEAMRGWQERGELFHLSGVPTDELRTLYAGALATLCPSVDEGFDLSGIEAMQCGSPVLASDIAVHREVYGEACLYFDPYAPADMAETIGRLVGDADGLRSRLHDLGLAQAERYRPRALEPQWAQFFEDLRAGRFGTPPGRPFDPSSVPSRSGWRAPPDASPRGLAVDELAQRRKARVGS